MAWRSSGAGPAVLLIHGGSIDSRMWDAQVAAFESTHRVITYDIRGLGGSPRPTSRYRLSDDALGVLDHLGVQSATIVGFSVGSQVALDLVARAPERIRALMVAAAYPWFEPLPPQFELARAQLIAALAPRTDAQRRGDLAAAVAADLDVWATMHEGEARAALTSMCMRAPYFHEYRASDDDWMWDTPLVDDKTLAKFGAPSLVAVGDRDAQFMQLAAPMLADTLGHAKLQVFRGADHFVSLLQPTEFNAALKDLLDKANA